jgi:hypothetical protein
MVTWRFLGDKKHNNSLVRRCPGVEALLRSSAGSRGYTVHARALVEERSIAARDALINIGEQ